MQFAWTLQTLKSGRLPWTYMNVSSLFAPFNLTDKQRMLSMRDASFSMIHIERLESLPFSVAEATAATWLIHGLITLPFALYKFTNCMRYITIGRYEPLGSSFLHEAWSLAFTYRCLKDEKEVFLKGEECTETPDHSLICRHIQLHGSCNQDRPNLACILKGTPVPAIVPTFTLLANGSYLLLNNEDCCGLIKGIAYVVTVSERVVCCKNVLYPPTHGNLDVSIWPRLPTLKADFHGMSRIRALLSQKEVALSSARETFVLHIANTRTEVQALLNTDLPLHFSELIHQIFNASSTSGPAHFFKIVSSGLVTSFEKIFGVIPAFFHSIFSSLFGGFPVLLALAAGVLMIFCFAKNGCPSCVRSRSAPPGTVSQPDA
ncbi:uncharacterized protein LOC144773783 [Lissotriton helveticus]